MTDQGSEVGLITKMVEKVEREETLPPVQPEAPPEPGDGTRSPGKRRTLVIGAALLVVAVSLGLGYTFFLKPEPEPPVKTPRRSTSARAKPGKPVQQPTEAKADAGTSSEEPSPTGVAAQSSNETEAAEGQVAQTEADMEAAPETSPGEQVSLFQPEIDRVPDDQAEPQTSSSTEEPALSEEEDVLPDEDLEDESTLFSPEESFSEGTTPSYASDPEPGWTERTVEVAERSESRAERYYKKGVSYQQEGTLSQAIESYTEALTFDPDHLQTHMNLATAYLQTSRFREAEQELAYLYAVRPKDPMVLFNFGLLLYRTGEYVSAEAKLRKLLEQDPFHLEANLLLASIYEERGGINKAVELCMRAYQINSAHPRVLYRLGRAHDMAGSPTEAARYYQLYLSTRSEKESQLELAVRDRLNHLLSQKEEP
jgi:tetratricopeptide (TPR) repeat protein